MSPVQTVLARTSGIFVCVMVWEIAGQYVGDTLLAPPSTVVPLLFRMVLDGKVLIELFGSLKLMILGFAFACAIGMPLGTLMGRIAVIDALVHPWISMLVVTSIAALAPIVMLLLGTGPAMRVAIIFAGSVGYIVLTAYHGSRGIDVRYVNVARSFSVHGLDQYRKVLLPALFPYLIIGARLGLIHAIRAMVVAEMFVITGYGGLIFQTGLDLTVAPLLAYLVLLMAVSLAAGAALQTAGRIAAPWYAAHYA